MSWKQSSHFNESNYMRKQYLLDSLKTYNLHELICNLCNYAALSDEEDTIFYMSSGSNLITKYSCKCRNTTISHDNKQIRVFKTIDNYCIQLNLSPNAVKTIIFEEKEPPCWVPIIEKKYMLFSDLSNHNS